MPSRTAKIDEALDGILFIDEACSLANGQQEDFGQEAVETLLKRMEDNRGRLVVIAAGSPDRMINSVRSNPGLKRRFTRFLQFQDFARDKLIQIFEALATRSGYNLSPFCASAAAEYLDSIRAADPSQFGNARDVRNVFEQAVRFQAQRFSSEKDEYSVDELKLLLAEDVPPTGNSHF